MDNRLNPSTPTKKASLGEKLGFYSNKPHTPLLTNFTKPLTVAQPQVFPIYTGGREETAATITNPPDILSLPINHPSSARKKILLTENKNKDLQSSRLTSKGNKERKNSEENPKKETVEKQTYKQTFHSENAMQSVQQYISECVQETPRHDQVTAYLESLEQQVHVHGVGPEKHRHKSDNCLNKDHHDLSAGVLLQDGQLLTHDVAVKRNSIPGVRTHTDSIGSSFSLDDSDTERAKCHDVCDMSSTGSSSRPQTVSNDSGFLEHIDAFLGTYSGKSKLPGYQSHHYLDEEDIAKEVFGEVDSENSCCKYLLGPKLVKQHMGSGEFEIEKKSKSVTLSKEQLIFILQRVELSKYKVILEERLADQSRQNKSQQRTLACLIQAVVILNKRLHCDKDRWLRLNHAIRKLQLEREMYMHRQARMTVCMCAILCLYLLNLKLVRTRLMSVISYFGIVETVKKINRTRKMIAENWRNIPSLLTNFWRIFIFRYSSRINTNLPCQNKLGS